MVPSAARSGSAASSARALLYNVLSHLKPRDFAVELWNGELWPAESKKPVFKLIFRSPNVVRAMFSRPSALSFGEAYIYGHLDVEGSLLDVFKSGEHLLTIDYSWSEKLTMARCLWSISTPDYSGGGVFGGDEAQKSKLDCICRKLRLEPGQRMLDLGCGWGALILHAAANYGVRTVGITLSPQQAEFARERIDAAGLSRQCRVEVGDFLGFRPAETFDRIVSVGAAEHVPEKSFERYFARAFSWLRPGGQFLHHAIVHAPTMAQRPGRSFMNRYVFPEHFLASIGRTVVRGEKAGFEVRDVESLREHYQLTWEQWLGHLEAAQAAVERRSDPLSFRVFRLYLAGSAYEFATGRLNIYQSLLLKPDRGRSSLPLTRADWYRAAKMTPARAERYLAACEEPSGRLDQGEAEQHHDRAERGVHL